MTNRSIKTIRLRVILFGIICTFISLLTVNAQTTTDSILNIINMELDGRGNYYVQKEEKISLLKNSLGGSYSRQHRIEVSNMLFDEYITYQYDSAYHYAQYSLMLARQENMLPYITKAQINVMHCYVASGLFKEAFQYLSNINLSHSSSGQKATYYSLVMRLYTNMMLNESNPFNKEYRVKARAYSDSIMMNLHSGTKEYAFYELLRSNLTIEDCRERISKYELVLHNHNFSVQEYATLYVYLGRDYERLNMMDYAIYYMSLSALYDIRSSIRQNTATTYLGKYLFDNKNIMLASKCIHAALDDANFYNAQHRKVLVNSVLPIIEAEKVNIIESQRNQRTMYLLVVSLLVVILLFTTIVIHRQNQKIKKARQNIQRQCDNISRMNEELHNTNNELELSKSKLEESYNMLSLSANKLEEANEIKDMYIIQSLYGNSEYMTRLEKLVKTVERKIQARQYHDLIELLYSEFNLKNEREMMYSSFDKTFQMIFPHFVEEYNRLFASEDQVTLGEDLSLSTELRIFALMRLGITENERIARFLNLSIKTVYSYRYKARAKSIVPKEDFEHLIMKIKKREKHII